jgi:hypothetical protein
VCFLVNNWQKTINFLKNQNEKNPVVRQSCGTEEIKKK